MDDIWDDKEVFTSGDYVKFDQPGDTITGTITAIGKQVFERGDVALRIELDTAEGPKTLTAGQYRLKAALKEQRPSVGNVLTVTFTSLEKLSGGKTLKHFDVVVGGNGHAPAAPAPAAAPAAAPATAPAPEATADPLAGLGLNAAQLAALRNLGGTPLL
jgi:hypothetical protein